MSFAGKHLSDELPKNIEIKPKDEMIEKQDGTIAMTGDGDEISMQIRSPQGMKKRNKDLGIDNNEL